MPRYSTENVNKILLAVSFLIPGTVTAADTLDCPRSKAKEIATVETGSESIVERQVAMRIRADGRPLIAYTGGLTNQQTLWLVDCLDKKCNSSRSAQIDSSSNYNFGLGFALSQDGRPLILTQYYGKLTYYECSDVLCAEKRKVEVETSNPGNIRSLEVMPDGKPMLIYSHGGTAPSDAYDVFAFVCSDTRCQSGVKTKLVDIDPDGDWFSSEASTELDAQGRLVLLYLNNNGGMLSGKMKLTRCAGADCTQTSTETVSQARAQTWSQRTSMFLLPDSRPLILDGQAGFFGASWGSLIECDSSDCQNTVSNTLFSSPSRHFAGVTVPQGGSPVLGVFDDATAGFYLCSDDDCTAGQSVVEAATTPAYRTSTLRANASGVPYLAYFSDGGRQLQLATCSLDIWANSFE